MVQAAKLRKLGFCGVDNSISPKILGVIFHAYNFVEWGILFRPDKVRSKMLNALRTSLNQDRLYLIIGPHG